MTHKSPSRFALFRISTSLLAILFTFGYAHAEDKSLGRVFAVADIYDCRDGAPLGRAVLVERPSDQGVKTVDVKIRVAGLEPGAHAVHIHETADCEPCGAAGGHFDPGPSGDSSPDGNHPFHMGDLENIKIGDDSRGSLQTVTTRITLSPGPLSIFDNDGSAFIIHDFEDTFCPDGQQAACAGGSRAACGVIEAI